MKRVTASEARRNWFRLLDEVAAGETIVIDRHGIRVVLQRQGHTEGPATDVPDYTDVLHVPCLDDAETWGWEWVEPGIALSARELRRR